MATTRVGNRPPKRAVAERLAQLTKIRGNIQRHVDRLQAFPPEDLIPYERGQLKYFVRQLGGLDTAIAKLKG